MAVNGWQEKIDFRVPVSPSGRPWRRLIDTVQPSPRDIVELDAGPRVAEEERYRVAARSVVVLVSEG